MKKPEKKNYTTPFTEELVMFNSKKFSKDMIKYVDFLHTEIKLAFDFLHNAGVNIGDQGDQCYQILEKLTKS